MGATAGTQLLIASAATSASAGVGSAFSAAGSAKASADYQSSVARTNATMAEMAADDAVRRGDKDVSRIRKATRRAIGAQRAAFAAQGIELDTGSASDVVEDTRTTGITEMITTKNNAVREAFGYKIQASSDTLSGKFASITGRSAERSSLITGGLNAARSGLDAVYQARKA